MVFCVVVATQGVAAEVKVTVTGVHSARGKVAVAICDRANFPNGQCAYTAAVPAKVGEVVLTVRGVPVGTWAAEVYHDEAGVGRLEFSLLGMPKQGFGFSRDAPMRFGPPSFADAAFPVGESGVETTVRLQYPPG